MESAGVERMVDHGHLIAGSEKGGLRGGGIKHQVQAGSGIGLDDELERIRKVYVRLAEKARSGVDDGRSDDGVPDIDELVEDKQRR